LIKNSHPFGIKCQKIAGGFFDSHCTSGRRSSDPRFLFIFNGAYAFSGLVFVIWARDRQTTDNDTIV